MCALVGSLGGRETVVSPRDPPARARDGGRSTPCGSGRMRHPLHPPLRDVGRWLRRRLFAPAGKTTLVTDDRSGRRRLARSLPGRAA